MGKNKSFTERVREYKRRLIAAALKANDGNVTNAAKSLRICRSDFYKVAKRCGHVMPNRFPGRKPPKEAGNAAWRALGDY